MNACGFDPVIVSEIKLLDFLWYYLIYVTKHVFFLFYAFDVKEFIAKLQNSQPCFKMHKKSKFNHLTNKR
jgi:hypothetical protein